MTGDESPTQYKAFYDRVLMWFALGKLSCDCEEITHDPLCPMGQLEAAAYELSAEIGEAYDSLRQIAPEWEGVARIRQGAGLDF